MSVGIHHFRKFLPHLSNSLGMSSMRYICDVERHAGLDARASPDISEIRQDLRDRAGQGCFICLECPKQGHYAALVPCLRPRRASKVIAYYGCGSGDERPIYEMTEPWDNACESDSDIFRRLVDTCYQYLGWWKRWLPYYGITEVREVNVRSYKSC